MPTTDPRHDPDHDPDECYDCLLEQGVNQHLPVCAVLPKKLIIEVGLEDMLSRGAPDQGERLADLHTIRTVTVRRAGNWRATFYGRDLACVFLGPGDKPLHHPRDKAPCLPPV